jgi:hypothetical protein
VYGKPIEIGGHPLEAALPHRGLPDLGQNGSVVTLSRATPVTVTFSIGDVHVYALGAEHVRITRPDGDREVVGFEQGRRLAHELAR